MPGDVAQTGSVKLLGLLNVNQLLSVMDVAYPRISDSSIAGDSLVVTASGKMMMWRLEMLEDISVMEKQSWLRILM